MFAELIAPDKLATVSGPGTVTVVPLIIITLPASSTLPTTELVPWIVGQEIFQSSDPTRTQLLLSFL